jgi:hypothetical protein
MKNFSIQIWLNVIANFHEKEEEKVYFLKSFAMHFSNVLMSVEKVSLICVETETSEMSLIMIHFDVELSRHINSSLEPQEAACFVL